MNHYKIWYTYTDPTNSDYGKLYESQGYFEDWNPKLWKMLLGTKAVIVKVTKA